MVSRDSDAGGDEFYTFDPSGSVAQRQDGGGGLLSSDVYDGFGNLQATTGGGADVFGFAGQWGGYTDAETGLVLMTHRFYDPQAGRFLTRDPLEYIGGVNLYGYCTNDPVNRSDPEGYKSYCGPNQFEEWRKAHAPYSDKKTFHDCMARLKNRNPTLKTCIDDDGEFYVQGKDGKPNYDEPLGNAWDCVRDCGPVKIGPPIIIKDPHPVNPQGPPVWIRIPPRVPIGPEPVPL